MHLLELIKRHAITADNGVPSWMLGYFKRYAISFADGTTDVDTHVCWLQSRNFTIDLRLPITSEQVAHKPVEQYNKQELRTLGNYEGWEAPCEWHKDTLSWGEGTSLQYHNRWIEPGILHRTGNCMIELSPSSAYIEDWRLQPSAPGPLIGLRLIDDTCIDTGTIRHKGGGLIVSGDYAALVLGRPTTAPENSVANQYRQDLIAAEGQQSLLSSLLQFETSVAKGSLNNNYQIQLSTCPARLNQHLFSLDGFEFQTETQQITHQFTDDTGAQRLRRFTIDTIEPLCHFVQTTPTPESSQHWYQQEAETLTRYTKPVFSH